MRRHLESRELGGADPLDTQLGVPAQPLLARLGLERYLPLLQRRAAFGLRPGIAPAIVLVPAGFLLGPQGSNILSIDLLAHLQHAIDGGVQRGPGHPGGKPFIDDAEAHERSVQAEDERAG